MKKLKLLGAAALFLTISFGSLFSLELGLITVLSSLSCTALTAVSTLTDNLLWKSSKVERLKDFIEENDSTLAVDLSRQHGRSLETVCTILEVKEEKRSKFKQILQKNYSVIYPSLEADSMYKAETMLEISELL